MSIKDMKKEDLELLSYKDMTNLLLEENGAKNTADLFREIVNLLELPNNVFESKIGDYYTMLTTDKRFLLLDDGTWDLRTRHTSDKIVTVIDEDDDGILEEPLVKEKIDIEEPDHHFNIESDEDDFDDGDDELKDLVVIDEDELGMEE